MAKKIFTCSQEQETQKLAEKVASIAKKGDIFALYGTLGAGKSTFSRYFIQCLSDIQDVPSPTFTLVQTYETSLFDLYHYDLYRLKSPEEAYELDIEEAFYTGVSLIEWPEKLATLLPKDIWKININIKNNLRIFEIEVSSFEKENRLKELDFE